MFMNFLKRWAPVMMFLLVVGLCVGFVLMNFADPKSEPEVVKALENKTTVEKALTAGKVSPNYIASPEQAARINFVETLSKNIERVKQRLPETEMGVNISYPQPVRPKSEPPPKIMDKNDIVAKMPLLDDSKFKAEEARGKIYVKCELPSTDNNAYLEMEPVRFEIFRGLSKDKIDTKTPWGIIEVGLENPPAPKAGVIVKENPQPAPPPAETLSSRGQAKRNPTTTDAPKGKDKPAPEIPLPQYERAFRDTKDIAQLTEYFYQVRLVARYTNVDGFKEIKKADNGENQEFTHHKPMDKNLTEIPPTNPGTVLFATPLTKPFSAKTPTNFQLRVVGVFGNVPGIDRVRNPEKHDDKSYNVTFEVYAWINDLQQWKEITIENVHEGEMLSGVAKYQVKGEAKEYDFTKDLAYKLFEVNTELIETFVKGKLEPKPVVILENLQLRAMTSATPAGLQISS